MLDRDTRANRNHKDSVFTALFGEKQNLLELYNAVTGKNYPEDTEIDIITLSNVLFMEQLNDICFVIDGRMVVLVEHQSSINENMCLRMLIYISREYEKITSSRNLYNEKRIKIPTPEFIVLYNGKDEFPDFKEMYLSDSFELMSEDCSLELVARVYNINKGRNAEMAGRSPTLDGYETFIAEIKGNLANKMSLPEAIRLAMRTCMSKNILLSFLKAHGSEVENMLITEWNTAEAIAVAKEEAFEDGIGKGMKKLLAYLKDGHSLEEAEKAFDLPTNHSLS